MKKFLTTIVALSITSLVLGGEPKPPILPKQPVNPAMQRIIDARKAKEAAAKEAARKEREANTLNPIPAYERLASFLTMEVIGEPTTQPTTQPSKYESNIPKLLTDLRKQVKDVQAALAEALTENALLHKKLDESPQKYKLVVVQNKKIADAIEAAKLEIGMTMDEANLAMNRAGATTEGIWRSKSENYESYEWHLRGGWTMSGDFKDGKLYAFSRS